jgi:predicted permease
VPPLVAVVVAVVLEQQELQDHDLVQRIQTVLALMSISQILFSVKLSLNQRINLLVQKHLPLNKECHGARLA